MYQKVLDSTTVMSLIKYAYIVSHLIGYIVCGCIDINGLPILLGMHFIPGPDKCLLCVCDDNDLPKWCKKVLCTPPEKCKSFVIGNSCCDFICTDTTLVSDTKDDMDRKFIISVTTAFFILTLMFFIVNKLRRRGLMRGLRTHRTIVNRRNVGNIGFIAGGVGYLNIPNEHQFDDNPMSHFSVYKPHANYFPTGEAPPPYDEVVADNSPFSGGVTALPTHTLTTSHNNNNNNNHNSEVGTSSSHQFVINNNINNNNNGNNTNTNEQATQMEIGTNEFQDGGQQHEDNNRLAGSSAYRHTTIPLMLRITHDADDNVEVQRSNSLLTTANNFERENSNRHVNSQTNISSSHTTLLGVPCSSSNVINNSNLTDSKFLPRVIKASLSAPLPSSNRDQSTTISATAFASSQNLPLISSKFDNSSSPSSRRELIKNNAANNKTNIADIIISNPRGKVKQTTAKRKSLKRRKDFVDKQQPPMVVGLNLSGSGVITAQHYDETSETNKIISQEDYHAECENCNVNVAAGDNAVIDGSVKEQETMTLQRHINDGKSCAAEQLLNVSLTLPTNSRAKRETVSKSKVGTLVHSTVPKSRLENVSSGDEDESELSSTTVQINDDVESTIER